MDDTSADARRVQLEALRRLTPGQKLALMDDLTRLARSMAIEGLRRRHPDASEEEIADRFAELTLGKDLAARVIASRRAKALRPAS